MSDPEIKKEDVKVDVKKVEEVKNKIEKFSQETEDIDEHVLKALATAKKIKEG